MSDLSDLYQEVILDHNRSPRNFRRMEGASHHAEGYNPLCGDRVTVFVQIEGDRIAADFEPDSAGIHRGHVEGTVELGKTRFIGRGGVETAVNVGERRYREILIELK